MVRLLFPLRQRPELSYKEWGREFGAPRLPRLHAGCDLIAANGTEILAVEDGTVIEGPYDFFLGTYALEVKHDSGIVVRYCEIQQTVPRGIGLGARVSRGQVIAYVGLMIGGSSMLHFEMYSGAVDGPLTTGLGPYRRRSDLLDPTPYLDAAIVGQPKPLQLGEARPNEHVTSVLNLRSQPNPDASIITTLGRDTVAKLIRKVDGGSYSAEGSTRNDWVELQTSGLTGFAAGYYVEIAKDDNDHNGQSDALGSAKVNNHVSSTLNLRAEANSRSAVLASLSPGMAVTVMAKVVGQDYLADNATRNDWYKVQSGVHTGYVAGFYLDFNEGHDTRPVRNALGRVNSGVTSVLNVRDKPSLEAAILFALAPDQTFEILESVKGDTYSGGRNDWQHIRHEKGTGYAAGYYISVNQQITPKNKWYELLLKVPTLGASVHTASQDGLAPGIAASETMAETDLTRIKNTINVLLAASARYGIPAALLAGAESRETRGGRVLGEDGWDQSHNAFGILQVDKNFHEIAGSDSPTSQRHVDQATGILAGCIDAVKELHPDWDDFYVLKGGVAAYNCGASNIRSIEGMDIGTTGDDYSSDVIARAKYYLRHVELPMLRQ